MKTYLGIVALVALAASLRTCQTDDTVSTGSDNITQLTETQQLFGSANTAAITLGQPDARWVLPSELREVSAIAVLDEGVLACVQDEEGIIYMYDLNKKAITNKITFAGAGDFEGIAVKGNTAYILRSDGAIFEVTDFRNPNPVVKEYGSELVETQNAEGLAYDKETNSLLIACKGFDASRKDEKGIYRFSLEDKKMQREPVISIPLLQDDLLKLSEKKKSNYDLLQPSTLEVHPVTGDLYTMDAKNYLILILDENGSIKKIEKLDENLLEQPEALSFGKNGEMYIASEGKRKGTLVKYNRSF